MPTDSRVALTTVALPDFGRAATLPELPLEIYRARLDQATERLAAADLDVLVVYGDREHCANLAFLTGFDPRFEEALLLLDRQGNGRLLVGNECLGYLPAAELGLAVELYQEFSLLGQPRGDSRPLRQLLGEAGIGTGKRVGCVGWKYWDDPAACDLPAYLVDLLRKQVGRQGAVVNATALFMAPADGLRTTAEPAQLAAFEFAATVTSEAVLALLRALREGVSECELERWLDGRGLPLSCHRMLSFGAKARRGLASPSANRARRGDVFTTALGVVGSLTCRAGWVAAGPADLPAAEREFSAAYAANYFATVAAWYGALRVGATAGAVFAAANAARDDRLFRFAVNPGHLLHLDEWVHSPFAAESPEPLRSGMVLQADLIPVSCGPFAYVNAEDGVVLADEPLRATLAAQYPELYTRAERRREFMRTTLGLAVDDSVLPLGNTPAWLAPYALALDQAFVQR